MVTEPSVRIEPRRARARILEAAARCVVREGVPAASMAAIALEAGVSKALLHYHFVDRAGLLSEVTASIGRRLMAREKAALEPSNSGGAVDLLWEWLDTELQRGELQAFLQLHEVREDVVRRVVEEINQARRVTATTTVDRVFARLGLEPRLSSDLLGDTVVAFTDGLALSHDVGKRHTRVSFDVFWLAMLSLGE